MTLLDILRASPVMPVLVIDRLEQAVPLARALVAGGIRVLEVTLRTPVALAAITAIREAVPDAIVGAGTVVDPQLFAQAEQAGAQFAVSPGLTAELLAAAAGAAMPLLPGAMTPSDVMAARAAGYFALKFFPAQQAGGVGMLKAFQGPFKDVLFCPTGGITLANAPEFLAQPNVVCVGGSWLAPRNLMEAQDWAAIQALAAHAASLA